MSNTEQSVKFNNVESDFEAIQKDVPQGSILEPELFNLFINDIFDFVSYNRLYNYVDDNTVSCADNVLRNVVDKLVHDSLLLI